MKKYIILIFGIFCFSNINCQIENSTEQQFNKRLAKDTTMIEQILRKQIEAGWGAENECCDIPNYKYSEADLKVTIPLIVKELSKNGYKNDIDLFNRGLKTIFNIQSIESAIYKINQIDPCNNNHKLDFSNFHEFPYIDLYIIKDCNIIINSFFLPELINYRAQYPEIGEFEKTVITTYTDKDGQKIKITLWKDNPDLDLQRKHNIQTLISRNKYLFNDDKSQIQWLITHDPEFVKSLVITFGYTKQIEFIRFVMNSYLKMHFKKRNKIGEIIFVKNCKGILQIREDLLDYILDNTIKEDNRLLSSLINYMDYIYNDEYDINTGYTTDEKRKIIGYIINTYQPLRDKYYQQQNTETVEWPASDYDILQDAYLHDEGIIAYFKQNNSFGLPELKKQVDNFYPPASEKH